MKLQNQDIKIGKTIDELVEGETFSLSETIKNREILLYLGLTNDDNPLYSQYDYIKELGLTKPVVPTALIFGIITSTINKHLPGPGSHVVNVNLNLIEKIFRNDLLSFNFEIIKIDTNKDLVTINIEIMRNEERVSDAIVLVQPPLEELTESE